VRRPFGGPNLSGSHPQKEESKRRSNHRRKRAEKLNLQGRRNKGINDRSNGLYCREEVRIIDERGGSDKFIVSAGGIVGNWMKRLELQFEWMQLKD
jgi:hypothetical protein